MIDLDKQPQVPDPFFLPFTPAVSPQVEPVSTEPPTELETELARLHIRGSVNSSSCRSSCSSSSNTSNSGGSSSSRSKFQHYHEPTILDRPEAIDAVKTAIAAQDRNALTHVAREYGLPPLLRAEAWALLLCGHPYVIAQRAQTPLEVVVDSELPLRRVRGDVRRLCQSRGISALHETAIFTALLSFLRTWSAKIPYEKPMAWIAMYLALGDSTDEEHADEVSVEFTGVKGDNLVDVFTDVILVLTYEPVPFSNFISEFRMSLPELAEHFASEGILSGNLGGDGWLVWWLKWFGIRALPASAMTRMWDIYFSMSGSDNEMRLTRIHIFNCLVIMKEHRGKLLELDQSECRQFLAAVPACNDVEAVVNEACLLEQASQSN